MKSDSIGTGTSGVEILNVSPHGFWLMVAEKEYFLDFEHFPWFRRATLEQLFRAELVHDDHLYWPDLDVDLDLDRIEHPERYPLVAQAEEQSEPLKGAANHSQPSQSGASRTSSSAGSDR